MSSLPMTTIEAVDVSTRFNTLISALNSARYWLRVWGARIDQRQQLRTLETWQLNDLGLTRVDADLESRKSFWRA